MQLCGWPRCSPTTFLFALAKVLDTLEDLADKGIPFPQLVELCSEVWCAEGQDESTDRSGLVDMHPRDHTERTQPDSQEARKAIRKMWLHGFDAITISRLTSVPLEKVDAYLYWARMEQTSRLVIEGHLAGRLVTQLATEFGMSRTRIEAILADAGYTPNIGREVKVGPGLRAMINYERGLGRTSGQIAEKLGISVDRVKNILYPRKRA